MGIADKPGQMTYGETLAYEHKVKRTLQLVFAECQKAGQKHAPMHTPHEGSSAIREEFEELWDHVKADTGRSKEALLEAIQLAAMAVRYVADLNPDPMP